MTKFILSTALPLSLLEPIQFIALLAGQHAVLPGARLVTVDAGLMDSQRAGCWSAG
jgi:hypothetical protein